VHGRFINPGMKRLKRGKEPKHNAAQSFEQLAGMRCPN
jgi:hypothetical protein